MPAVLLAAHDPDGAQPPLGALQQALRALAGAVSASDTPALGAADHCDELLCADMPELLKLSISALPNLRLIFRAAEDREDAVVSWASQTCRGPAPPPAGWPQASATAWPEAMEQLREWWRVVEREIQLWLLHAHQEAMIRELAIEALRAGRAVMDGAGNIVAVDEAPA